MVHGRQAILDKLLGYERHTGRYALLLLRGREALQRAGLRECGHRPVGHLAVEFALLILVIGPTKRVGRVLRNARPLEGHAVIKPGVTAAMVDEDRVFSR